jgi:cleavage and polyadenylation specificity factor subunit 3
MSMSQVIQRQSIHYSGAMPVLRHLLAQVAGNVEVLEEKKLRIFQNVDLTLDNKIITLEVQRSPDTQCFPFVSVWLVLLHFMNT